MYQNEVMDSPVADDVRRDSPGKRLNFEGAFSEAAQTGDASGQDTCGRDFTAHSDAQKVLRFLEPEIRSKFESVCREFRENYRSSTRKYIADVFLPRNDEFGDQAIRYLAERTSQRSSGFFGFSAEKDHIHVIHDCSYSGRSCRCRFREVLGCLGTLKRNERFLRNCSDIQESDWTRILFYYFFAKRGVKGLSNQGIPIRFPLDSEFVHNRELVREWTKEFREKQTVWGQHDAPAEQYRNKRSIGNIDNSFEKGFHDEESNSQGFHGKKSKREPIWNVIREQVFKLLEQFHPAPLQAIRSVEVFKESSILTNPKHEMYINKALQLYSDRMINYNMRDYYNLLNNCPNPVFFKGVEYGTREASLDILDQLIKFQFNDDQGLIEEFLQTFIDIMDRKIPKRNCIVLYSPPSAGKNFFIDMVCAIVVNYGQLGMANRHNQFAFQEAPNKRMIIWNEPNYEPAMIDTIKMMFAGDPYTVRVKHAQDTAVSKTPVIVMTNNRCTFMQGSVFADRVSVFNWKSASFLKNCNFKPHPMSFFDLLNKYNIQF